MRNRRQGVKNVKFLVKVEKTEYNTSYIQK